MFYVTVLCNNSNGELTPQAVQKADHPIDTIVEHLSFLYSAKVKGDVTDKAMLECDDGDVLCITKTKQEVSAMLYIDCPEFDAELAYRFVKAITQ